MLYSIGLQQIHHSLIKPQNVSEKFYVCCLDCKIQVIYTFISSSLYIRVDIDNLLDNLHKLLA